jgi:hypothetical protein
MATVDRAVVLGITKKPSAGVTHDDRARRPRKSLLIFLKSDPPLNVGIRKLM